MNRSDVFISYRRVNKEFAQMLDHAFKNEGLEVWVDWEDIAPGVPDFTVEIEEGIEGSDVFVPVLSPAYLESPYCMGELQMAIDLHKRIVPLVHEKFDVDQLPSEIQAINWVYFTPHVGEENEFEDAFPVLMEALRSDYDHLAAHTRYFLRAKEWDEGDRKISLLLYGTEIDEAERWLAGAGEKNPTPVTLHTEFIFASRTHQRGQQRRFLTGVIFALVLSLALAIIAVFQTFEARAAEDEANQAAIVAEEAREAAVLAQEEAEIQRLEANSLLWSNYAIQQASENNTRLAIPLALAANEIPNIDIPPFSQQALASAAYAPGPRRVFEAYRDLPEDQIERIWTLAYNLDERNIVTGTSSGELIAWDVENAESPLWRRQAHQGSVWDVMYTSDDNAIVSTGADGKIIFWDVETQEPITEYSTPAQNSIWSIDIDPSGRFMVGGGIDGFVYVWNLVDGTITQQLDTNNEAVWSVEFSRGGQFLSAGGSDGNAVIWDGRSFLPRGSVNHGSSAVWSVTFSPDETILLTGGADGRIRSWDIESNAGRSPTYQGPQDRILDVEFSADSRNVIAASADNTIYLWDAGSAQPTTIYEGHGDVVWDVQPARPIKNNFISASADGSVILWDIQGGAEEATFDMGNSITTAKFSNDGSLIVYAQDTFNIARQDVNAGGQVFFGVQHVSEVNDLAFSPDGQTMLSAGDRRILVWDPTFVSLRDQMEGHEDNIQAVTYDADGEYIYSAGSDSNIFRWDAETLELDLEFDVHHQGTIWDIDTNPVRHELASAGSDRFVILWNTETGEPLEPEADGLKDYHEDIVRAVDYNHDGTLLASGGDDQVVILYNLETKEFQRFSGHGAPVHAVEFSPDGQFIASGDSRGVVIIWDLAGNPLRIYDTAHNEAITSITFDPTGAPRLLSSSMDGQLVLWRSDSLANLIAWTKENRDIRDLTCLELEQFQVQPGACIGENPPDDIQLEDLSATQESTASPEADSEL